VRTAERGGGDLVRVQNVKEGVGIFVQGCCVDHDLKEG
jgi:hypothetical protein